MIGTGTLYALGMGPGDPELLTLKAARALRDADVVFAASSTKNDYSLSLDIARPHLRPGVEIRVLGFPMTRDQDALSSAWEANAAEIAEELRQGRAAAFLTLGDPMLYSTFGYLLAPLRRILPGLRLEVVPGVTSFQAAAAATHTVLAQGRESLLTLSGVAGSKGLAEKLAQADNAVILKAYRDWPAIREAARAAGRAREAVFATQLGMAGQDIQRGEAGLDKVEAPHYLSLLLLPTNRGTGEG